MKRSNRHFLPPLVASIALFALMGLISCKEDVQDTTDIVIPSKNVSYGKDIEPLFQRACAFSGCHDSESKAGAYSMETWWDVMSSKPGMVYAKDTANSVLVWTLIGKNNKARMPFNRPALNANQIHGINVWINEGAQNN